MLQRTMLALSLLAVAAAGGCSKSVEAPAAPPDESAAAAPAEPAAVPAAATPEPETPPSIALPEGLPAVAHIYPEITVTEATTLNADEKQFEIKGESRKSVVEVLNYYIKYFRDNGWEEDMIMEQPGNTVVSFQKDGILEYVEAQEGGYGCYVTITIGKN